MYIKNYNSILLYILTFIVTIYISIPTFSSAPCWPDGDRYIFNGILIHDAIRDSAYFRPYQYAANYYAHYPVFSLPYGPPFFAFIFAIAFAIFGISYTTAHLVILFFTLSAGMTSLIVLKKITKNLSVAVITTAIVLFNPLSIIYVRDISPELPIIFFSFLTIYLFWQYFENEKKIYGILSAFSFSIGFLTKPYIFPLGIAIGLYSVVFIIYKNKWLFFKKRETWFAIALTIILIVPYSFLAKHFAHNEFSVINGYVSQPKSNVELFISDLFFRIVHAWKYMAIIIIAAVPGCIYGLYKRNRFFIFLFIWIICWHIFFAFMVRSPDDKYFLSVLPAYAIYAGYTINLLTQKLVRFKWRYIVPLLFIFWIGFSTVSTPIFFNNGYEEAGRFIASHPHEKSILYYGPYEGSFALGIRAVLPRESPFILRGERILSVRTAYGNAVQYQIVKDKDDILKLFDKYRIGYVVIQPEYIWAEKFPEFILLKEVLQSHPFQLIKIFPINTNYQSSKQPQLMVYAYNNTGCSSAPSENVVIPVPTLEKSLIIPLSP